MGQACAQHCKGQKDSHVCNLNPQRCRQLNRIDDAKCRESNANDEACGPGFLCDQISDNSTHKSSSSVANKCAELCRDGTLLHDGIVTKKDLDCEYLLHLKAKTNAELKTYIQTSPNRYNI